MLLCVGTGVSYLLWHIVTGPFVFDRYVWFAMPLLLTVVAGALPDEVNGPRHFLDYLQRTGRLQPEVPSVWWVENPRYRLAFRARTDPACPDDARYPYWSALGKSALYVLDCEAPPALGGNSGE